MSDTVDHDDRSEAGVNSPTMFPPLVDRAIVITGATASGKSAVAVKLAERLGAEILSLDSIAVYRGMDIGTAKPGPQERQRVPHHLIDLVEPNQEFSVACYLRAAHEKLSEIETGGARAIFVGGTPMFLKAVLRGFDAGPPADWEFRRAVEEDVAQHGIEALYERLRQVDPLAAHQIAPTDKRRMIRALEVARQTGVPLSHRQTQFVQSRPAQQCHVFAIKRPRDQLHQRINRRVGQMFETGLVDEVRDLLDQYGALSRTASQAVGYREVIEWIRDGGSLEKTLESVAAHTRQLARRQETWFRSFSEVRPLDVSDSCSVDMLVEMVARTIL
jgi:tRNA dimethylallyltransferase